MNNPELDTYHKALAFNKDNIMNNRGQTTINNNV